MSADKGLEVNPLVAVILVLCAPSRFVEAATRHDLEVEFATTAQLRSAYPDRQVPADKIEEFRSRARERTTKLRHAVFSSIGLATSAISAGLIVGIVLKRLAGPAPAIATAILQIGGAGVILGATLAEVGREIQSWTQATLAERVNLWVFRTLYVFGTFVIVVSIGWSGR